MFFGGIEKQVVLLRHPEMVEPVVTGGEAPELSCEAPPLIVGAVTPLVGEDRHWLQDAAQYCAFCPAV